MNEPAKSRVIWMLNHYAQMPGGAGGSTRHYSLCKYLRPHGWQGFILAASTELNTGTQRLTDNEQSRLEVVDDVNYLWLKCPSYSGNGLARMRNMLVFFWQAMRKRQTGMLPHPDVILGSSPHPFAALAGYMLAKRYRVPFIYEVRDLWPDSLIELGSISGNHPLSMLFRWIETKLARKSARIVTIPPLVKHYFAPKRIPSEKIVWVANGIDLGFFPTPTPKDDTDKFQFMYFGAHGNGNALHHVLDAMKLLQDRPDAQEIHLRLIGDGPLKAELVQQADFLELKNVTFEAPVPKKEIPALAAQADGFVFNVMDAPVLTKYGISPNKLFDFFAAGRPILFACSAVNNPVLEAEAGLSVQAGSAEKLAEGMMQLANMPLAERQAMGRRGRAYVEANHSFTALAAKLADMLARVVTEGK